MIRFGVLAAAFAAAALAACARDAAPTGGADACPPAQSLPVTGLCADGRATLFDAIAEDMTPPDPRCVWRTEQAMLGADRALVFRVRDCVPAGRDPTVFVADGGVVSILPTTPNATPIPVITVFERPQGDRFAVLQQRIAALPAPERERCAIAPYAAPFVTEAFRIVPDPRYAAELAAEAAPGAALAACGPYGVSARETFWTIADGWAVFLDLDDGEPLFDPRSLTIYGPPSNSGSSGVSGGGTWVKVSGAAG